MQSSGPSAIQQPSIVFRGKALGSRSTTQAASCRAARSMGADSVLPVQLRKKEEHADDTPIYVRSKPIIISRPVCLFPAFALFVAMVLKSSVFMTASRHFCICAKSSKSM